MCFILQERWEGVIFAVLEKRPSRSRLQANKKHLEFSGVYHQQYMSVKVKIGGSRREGQSEEEIMNNRRAYSC